MENPVTQHLDIWTSALENKANGGRGKSSNGQTAYGIKKLRELILELAVRGKLVPQDPDDEPSSELLKKIAREKARLIKEGKIKKQKTLPEITEDEKPFELPGGWEWAKLGNFVYLEMGQSPQSKFYNQAKDGIPFFQGKADFGDIYPTVKYWCIEPLKFAYPGDVLLSVRAPVGPTNISNIECCIGRGLSALRPLAGVCTEVVLVILRAFQKKLEEKATGTTFRAVSKKDIESLLIPVPPLDEQKRIAAKVDALMALCDQLEQEQTDSLAAHQTLVETLLSTLTAAKDHDDLKSSWQHVADHFDTLFTTEHSIDQLKQTILQLAVMGKLVPQDPNDEPASELLKKIAREKARLIKEGKIKKQNPLPEITEDEKPFDLPNGWEWVLVGQVFSLRSGTSFKKEKELTHGQYLYVKVADMNLNGNELEITTSSRFIDPSSKDLNALIPMGSIIFPKRGGAIATNKKRFVKRKLFVDLNVMAITPFQGVNLDYAYCWLQSIDLALLNSGTSVPQINNKDIEPLLFPLPPLVEQHRIVAKVDKLMALCEQLKARISDSQATQIKLAESIVERAVV